MNGMKEVKGEKFEKRVAELFEIMGYDVERDKIISSSQIDVYVEKEYPFFPYRMIIECKDIKNDNVGINEVHRLHSIVVNAQKKRIANKGVIIAHKGFTKEAKDLANEIDEIELVTFQEVSNKLINVTDYINKTINDFENSELSKYYIDLRCQDEKGQTCEPLENFINTWLSDKGRNHISILGDYGTGKTSFCLKFAYECAKKYKKNPLNNRIPITIPLHNYVKFGNIRQLITDLLINEYGIQINNYCAFERLLHNGKFLLILDGFDEMANKVEKNTILENFKELKKLAVPNSKTILTCRTHYFKTEKEIDELLELKEEPLLASEIRKKKGFEIIYLCRLEECQIEGYLKLHFHDNWNQYLAQIQHIYNLKELAKTPIFLDLVIKTLPKLKKIKDEVITSTRLYEIYTNFWIEREDEKSLITQADKTLFMEELAFQLYINKRFSIHFDELSDTIRKYFSNIPLEHLDYDIRNCSFLNCDKQGYYQFSHRSFMEFFVAKKIAREIEKEDYSTFGKEYLSFEIDRFLSDILIKSGNINMVINWLESHSDPNVRMNAAITLGRCENQSFIPLLKKCLDKEEDIGVAGRISEALKDLGDEDSLLKFLSNLDKYSYLVTKTNKKDPSHRLLYEVVGRLKIKDEDETVVSALIKNLESPNLRVRKYATFILGRIGNKKAVPYLIEILQKEKDIRTRLYAAAALGIIGDEKAMEILSYVAENDDNPFLQEECKKSLKMISGKS